MVRRVQGSLHVGQAMMIRPRKSLDDEIKTIEKLLGIDSPGFFCRLISKSSRKFVACFWFVVTALAVQRETTKVVTTNLLKTSVKLY